jgi:ribosome-associated toxin RatA of RatAB toxin-antitoxin module
MLKTLLLQPVTKRHIERRIVNTCAQHFFQIVQDVDKYQEFLPLCSHSKVLRRQGRVFDATLTVGLPPIFSEDFVSRVTVNVDELVVETKSIRSKLIDQISSRWKLTKLGENKTDVDFCMEMTVSDPLIVSVLDKVLKEVAGRQVEAFEHRCHAVPRS